MESYRIYKSLPLDDLMENFSFVCAKLNVLITPLIQEINYLKTRPLIETELKERFITEVKKLIAIAPKNGGFSCSFADCGRYYEVIPDSNNVKTKLFMFEDGENITPLLLSLDPDSSLTIDEAFEEALKLAAKDHCEDYVSSIPDKYLTQAGLFREELNYSICDEEFILGSRQKRYGFDLCYCRCCDRSVNGFCGKYCCNHSGDAIADCFRSDDRTVLNLLYDGRCVEMIQTDDTTPPTPKEAAELLAKDNDYRSYDTMIYEIVNSRDYDSDLWAYNK